jgi:two-component system sensor histidine kinase ChiS
MLEKQSILDVNLGDQVQRDMAILFSDIRSFTALSEKMTPKENFDFINTYLDKVGPVIRHHKGFIDKYIGDAVMALFPNSAQDALEAALSMQKKVSEWNAERQTKGQEAIAIGIGIHWGNVMLGTIGEHERMDGTVISDAVNLASRIESLTKLYGARILISDTAWQRIANPQNYAHRIVDRVSVKGKTEPVTIIEVFAADEPGMIKSKLRQLQQFAEALLLYQRGLFHEAKTAFLSLAAAEPADTVPALYLQRLEKYLLAPPKDWAGFEVLTEK